MNKEDIKNFKIKVNEAELFEIDKDIKLADLLTLLENNNVTDDDKIEII